MNYKFLLILSFLIFSCNSKKEKKIKDVISKPKKIEKEIILKNNIYHSNFNNVISEGDYEEVFGNYVEDRFMNNKRALHLDGVNEYAKIEDHKDLNPSDELSISIWYKPILFRGQGNNPILIKLNENDKEPFAQYKFALLGTSTQDTKVL